MQAPRGSTRRERAHDQRLSRHLPGVLVFAEKTTSRPPERLTLTDQTADLVGRFLDLTERKRGNAPRTRKLRLATSRLGSVRRRRSSSRPSVVETGPARWGQPAGRWAEWEISARTDDAAPGLKWRQAADEEQPQCGAGAARRRSHATRFGVVDASLSVRPAAAKPASSSLCHRSCVTNSIHREHIPERTTSGDARARALGSSRN